MSKESDYIINQINQAPKDFKGDESSFIIDRIKQSGDDEFDNKVQEELTRIYKLYENGEMTNDEFKYIEASLEELKKNKEELMSRNATFGVALTTQEAVKQGEPRYKLMVMQDKNPFTQDLPSGDTMGTGDFK